MRGNDKQAMLKEFARIVSPVLQVSYGKLKRCPGRAGLSCLCKPAVLAASLG